jgi:hypothetical protein
MAPAQCQVWQCRTVTQMRECKTWHLGPKVESIRHHLVVSKVESIRHLLVACICEKHNDGTGPQNRGSVLGDWLAERGPQMSEVPMALSRLSGIGWRPRADSTPSSAALASRGGARLVLAPDSAARLLRLDPREHLVEVVSHIAAKLDVRDSAGPSVLPHPANRDAQHLCNFRCFQELDAHVPARP